MSQNNRRSMDRVGHRRTRRDFVISGRKLSIESLERRCPLDASFSLGCLDPSEIVELQTVSDATAEVGTHWEASSRDPQLSSGFSGALRGIEEVAIRPIAGDTILLLPQDEGADWEESDLTDEDNLKCEQLSDGVGGEPPETPFLPDGDPKTTGKPFFESEWAPPLVRVVAPQNPQGSLSLDPTAASPSGSIAGVEEGSAAGGLSNTMAGDGRLNSANILRRSEVSLTKTHYYDSSDENRSSHGELKPLDTVSLATFPRDWIHEASSVHKLGSAIEGTSRSPNKAEPVSHLVADLARLAPERVATQDRERMVDAPPTTVEDFVNDFALLAVLEKPADDAAVELTEPTAACIRGVGINAGRWALVGILLSYRFPRGSSDFYNWGGRFVRAPKTRS